MPNIFELLEIIQLELRNPFVKFLDFLLVVNSEVLLYLFLRIHIVQYKSVLRRAKIPEKIFCVLLFLVLLLLLRLRLIFLAR